MRSLLQTYICLSIILWLSNAFKCFLPHSKILDQAFYDPKQDFTCFDGSRTISFSSVNDDYCDCADSSDEPGTSACPEGKFYCPNIGFKGKYIQSSRVNDGICDCCDGSDEYDSHVACYNECLKDGEEDRLKREQELAEANVGYELKIGYIQRGESARTEKQTEVDNINSQLEERRARLEELKALKEAAEGPEKEAKDVHQKEWDELQEKLKAEKETLERTTAFSLLDTDKNGWIEISELMSNHYLQNDVTEDEAKDLLGGDAMIGLDGFSNILWEAIRPRYLKDGRQPIEESTQVDSEQTNEEGAGAINEEEQPPEEVAPVETPPTEPAQVVYEGDYDGEDDNADDADEDEEDEDDDLDESGDYEARGSQETPPQRKHDESMPDYPEETKKLIEVADAAREEFNNVDREVRDFEQKQKDLQDYLGIDFGKEHEFSALKGDCREYTDREYTYKLCPFEKVTQRSKSGGSETDLGRWGKWVQEGDYSRMKYENGQGCWNGPSRSTLVTMSCGKENTVISVSEPSRCEYNMEFKTPALCDKVEHTHTEL